MNPIPTEVTPAVYGMAVIILLQLSQFFFAWKKDQRGEQGANKGDLLELKHEITSLRTELRNDISDVSNDVEELKTSVESKMEAARMESSRSRNDLYIQINGNALKTAGLIESTDTLKQSVISLTNKVDLLRVHNPPPTNGRKLS